MQFFINYKGVKLLMNNVLDYIANPLGQFLRFIYDNVAFANYGLAIIILTVIVRLVLLPIYVKQTRSMAKLQELQPQLQEIQKRYKNDKEKLNQELMKFYQENSYNPAGGCLPMLLQIPIFFALYMVIRSPLVYMHIKTQAEVTKLISDYASKMHIPVKAVQEIDIIELHKLLNMKFLWIFNLGVRPEWSPAKLMSNPALYIPLIFIPILATVTSFISIKFSYKATSVNTDNAMQNAMQKNMLFTMPIMSGFIAFSVPAGLGLYWIIGNIIQMLQQMYMNKFIIAKKEVVKT